MKVTLEIPENIEFQFVYRQLFSKVLEVETRSDVTFTLFRGARSAVGSFRLLRKHLGLFGTLKTIAKHATRRRRMYLITMNDRIVSTGWCMIGKCKYYQVENQAVIIGPIWSSDEVRGQGIATYAMRMAINEMIHQGNSLFYIDTSKSNFPAQRVFEKIGFGAPAALYLRL